MLETILINCDRYTNLLTVTSCFSCCHLSTAMSFCIFKCRHKAAKLLLAAVRPIAARHRSIAMATCRTRTFLNLPVLSESTTCSVRLSPCRAYRVKTPAILKGGRRWMMHVGDLNQYTLLLIYTIMIYVSGKQQVSGLGVCHLRNHLHYISFIYNKIFHHRECGVLRVDFQKNICNIMYPFPFLTSYRFLSGENRQSMLLGASLEACYVVPLQRHAIWVPL